MRVCKEEKGKRKKEIRNGKNVLFYIYIDDDESYILWMIIVETFNKRCSKNTYALFFCVYK